jgi:hypothetical protein
MEKNVSKMAEDGFERKARDKSAKKKRKKKKKKYSWKRARFKICRKQATPKKAYYQNKEV